MTVGWDDDVQVTLWPGLAPLDRDVVADACVVGLGASGLAAVAALADRGLTVVGVDAGRVAAGAAGRNGGFLLGGPAPFFHDAVARWGPEAAVAIYRETLVEIDRLAATLGPAVVRRTGSIRLAGLPGEPRTPAEAADRERERADCVRQADALRAHGIAVEQYSGPLGAGLYLPDDAATNPARRALAQARALVGRARLHERTPVRSVGATTVVTDHATVSCGIVIVAVDGRLELLVPQVAGVVRTARLEMLATEPLGTTVLPCPVYGRWGYDYAQQDPAGRLFVGGGRDLVGGDWTTDTEPSLAVQSYLDRLAPRFGARGERIAARWAASVGYTDDGRPLCRAVSDTVVAVGGYSGTGNLVGPVAARAAVALAIDGTPPPPYLRP